MSDRLNPYQEKIRQLGSDWLGEQIVRLGDYSETVETGVPGQYYARQGNGKVIKAHNTIGVSPDFDTRVKVVRSRFQPNIWKIVETLEDYTEPVSAGRLAYHHKQHEEGGPDRLTLDRKQIRQLSARAAGGWDVRVFGATVQTATGIVFVNNETLDLSGEVVTAGAKYVSIEADDNGDLSLNPGTPFAAPNVGTAADIPAPASGMYPLAYVLMYESQTEIIDNNIRPFLSLPGIVPAGMAADADYDVISGNDPDTDVTGAELEELTDGSETILHSHAGGSGAFIVMETGVTFPPVPLTNAEGDDWIYAT